MQKGVLSLFLSGAVMTALTVSGAKIEFATQFSHGTHDELSVNGVKVLPLYTEHYRSLGLPGTETLPEELRVEQHRVPTELVVNSFGLGIRTAIDIHTPTGFFGRDPGLDWIDSYALSYADYRPDEKRTSSLNVSFKENVFLHFGARIESVLFEILMVTTGYEDTTSLQLWHFDRDFIREELGASTKTLQWPRFGELDFWWSPDRLNTGYYIKSVEYKYVPEPAAGLMTMVFVGSIALIRRNARRRSD